MTLPYPGDLNQHWARVLTLASALNNAFQRRFPIPPGTFHSLNIRMRATIYASMLRRFRVTPGPRMIRCLEQLAMKP